MSRSNASESAICRPSKTKARKAPAESAGGEAISPDLGVSPGGQLNGELSCPNCGRHRGANCQLRTERTRKVSQVEGPTRKSHWPDSQDWNAENCQIKSSHSSTDRGVWPESVTASDTSEVHRRCLDWSGRYAGNRACIERMRTECRLDGRSCEIAMNTVSVWCSSPGRNDLASSEVEQREIPCIFDRTYRPEVFRHK